MKIGPNLRETLYVALGIGAIFLAGHMSQENRIRKEKETQLQIRDTYEAIGKSLDTMKGTNAQITMEAGQDFLNYVGVNYQLKSNEIVVLDVSMANNWQNVYVSIVNQHTQGGGIVPGITTRSNLQSYVEAHTK